MAGSAQATVDDAWDALDLVVSSLREAEGDTVVADAHVIAKLHLVAAAQRDLANLGEPARTPRGFDS